MGAMLTEWRELFESMLDGLANPAQMHGMMVHLPIAAAIMGLLVVILLAATRGQSWGARASALLIYIVGIIAAFVTVETGEKAHHFLRDSGVALSPAAIRMLHEHEEAAEKLWIFMAVTAALVLLTAVSKRWLRWTATALALAAALACAGWVGIVGHYGGTMVYNQGVGVPTAESNLPAEAIPKRNKTAREAAVGTTAQPDNPDEKTNPEFFGIPVEEHAKQR